jgi:hypothetical protein
MSTQSNDAILFKDEIADTGLVPVSKPYILYYRTGNNPHPQFFIFFHSSPDFRKVVERIKRHCELMNLLFITTRPMIVNLDEAEIRAFGHPAERGE